MNFQELVCCISVKFLPSFPLKINYVFFHLSDLYAVLGFGVYTDLG